MEDPQENSGPRLRHLSRIRKRLLRGQLLRSERDRGRRESGARGGSLRMRRGGDPDHLRNQVEGAVAMGIGGALFEHIDFAENQILTDRLSRYRVPRFADMPLIETVLLDRKDLPSAAAGETSIMGLAPAIGNAIFDATGQRIRSLPMVPNKLPAAGISPPAY